MLSWVCCCCFIFAYFFLFCFVLFLSSEHGFYDFRLSLVVTLDANFEECCFNTTDYKSVNNKLLLSFLHEDSSQLRKTHVILTHIFTAWPLHRTAAVSLFGL